MDLQVSGLYSILQNTIQNGQYGVYLQDSSFNNISKNNVRNTEGLFIEQGNCETNIFTDNTWIPASDILMLLKLLLMTIGYSSIGVYAAIVIIRRQKNRT